MSLNRATLIGRVGKDPEIKKTTNGSKVANFTIATSESWKDKNTGEKNEKTMWHNLVVWDERLIDGILSKYVHKGDEILIEGQIENRKYTDTNGVERWITEIVLKSFNSKVLLLSGGKKGAPANDARDGGGAGEKKGNAPVHPHGVDISDEIPFNPCVN